MQKLAPGPLISSCLTQRHTHPNGSCSQLPQTLSSPCSSRRKTQTQGCLATWLPGPLSSHWAVQLTAYEPSHTDVLALTHAFWWHHRSTTEPHDPWCRHQDPHTHTCSQHRAPQLTGVRHPVAAQGHSELRAVPCFRNTNTHSAQQDVRWQII